MQRGCIVVATSIHIGVSSKKAGKSRNTSQERRDRILKHGKEGAKGRRRVMGTLVGGQEGSIYSSGWACGIGEHIYMRCLP